MLFRTEVALKIDKITNWVHKDLSFNTFDKRYKIIRSKKIELNMNFI
jgi:hypothetical protein